jgi:hypothetical protein
MSNPSTAKAQAQKARDELASALDAIEDKFNVPKRAQELGKSAMTPVCPLVRLPNAIGVAE